MSIIWEIGRDMLSTTLLNPFELSGGEKYQRLFYALSISSEHRNHNGFTVTHPDCSSYDLTPYQFSKEDIVSILKDRDKRKGQSTMALSMLRKHFSEQVYRYS